MSRDLERAIAPPPPGSATDLKLKFRGANLLYPNSLGPSAPSLSRIIIILANVAVDKGYVALSNLRNGHVALSILGV